MDDALRIIVRSGPYAQWQNLPAADRLLAEETRLWLVDDDASHPFTFVSICDYFDLEPTVVRSGAWRLRADQVCRTRAADIGYTKIGAERQRWWTK